MSDPQATGPEEVAGGDDSRHWWRLIAIWVVLSAILDPLFYFLAGPHIPPGTMTNTAAGAQFDFNVLFVIALPVLLGVWIYMIYAFVMWRASRGGPDPVGGPAARGHFGIQLGWILITSVLVLFLAGFGTYELVQPGGRRGLQPHLDADIEDHPSDPGHRPAVEVHLSLPDFRRLRDQSTGHSRPHEHRVQRHVSRRDPQLLGLPVGREG